MILPSRLSGAWDSDFGGWGKRIEQLPVVGDGLSDLFFCCGHAAMVHRGERFRGGFSERWLARIACSAKRRQWCEEILFAQMTKAVVSVTLTRIELCIR